MEFQTQLLKMFNWLLVVSIALFFYTRENYPCFYQCLPVYILITISTHSSDENITRGVSGGPDWQFGTSCWSRRPFSAAPPSWRRTLARWAARTACTGWWTGPARPSAPPGSRTPAARAGPRRRSGRPGTAGTRPRCTPPELRNRIRAHEPFPEQNLNVAGRCFKHRWKAAQRTRIVVAENVAKAPEYDNRYCVTKIQNKLVHLSAECWTMGHVISFYSPSLFKKSLCAKIVAQLEAQPRHWGEQIATRTSIGRALGAVQFQNRVANLQTRSIILTRYSCFRVGSK